MTPHAKNAPVSGGIRETRRIHSGTPPKLTPPDNVAMSAMDGCTAICQWPTNSLLQSVRLVACWLQRTSYRGAVLLPKVQISDGLTHAATAWDTRRGTPTLEACNACARLCSVESLPNMLMVPFSGGCGGVPERDRMRQRRAAPILNSSEQAVGRVNLFFRTPLASSSVVHI